MKTLMILVMCLSLVGCFRGMQDTQTSRIVIFEGPIDGSATIEPGEYQNGIEIYNSYIDIAIIGGPTLNGSAVFYAEENGEYWLLLDVSMLSSGDVFTIELNGEIKEYEVI